MVDFLLISLKYYKKQCKLKTTSESINYSQYSLESLAIFARICITLDKN